MQMNLGGLKKSPQNPEDWDLNPGDFQNMCQNQKRRLFLSWYTVLLLFWQ